MYSSLLPIHSNRGAVSGRNGSSRILYTHRPEAGYREGAERPCGVRGAECSMWGTTGAVTRSAFPSLDTPFPNSLIGRSRLGVRTFARRTLEPLSLLVLAGPGRLEAGVSHQSYRHVMGCGIAGWEPTFRGRCSQSQRPYFAPLLPCRAPLTPHPALSCYLPI